MQREYVALTLAEQSGLNITAQDVIGASAEETTGFLNASECLLCSVSVAAAAAVQLQAAQGVEGPAPVHLHALRACKCCRLQTPAACCSACRMSGLDSHATAVYHYLDAGGSPFPWTIIRGSSDYT